MLCPIFFIGRAAIMNSILIGRRTDLHTNVSYDVYTVH